jgi:hypothetical protein
LRARGNNTNQREYGDQQNLVVPTALIAELGITDDAPYTLEQTSRGDTAANKVRSQYHVHLPPAAWAQARQGAK